MDPWLHGLRFSGSITKNCDTGFEMRSEIGNEEIAKDFRCATNLGSVLRCSVERHDRGDEVFDGLSRAHCRAI